MSVAPRTDPLPESLRDEGALMSRTAGVLWLLAVGVALGGQLLPSAPHEHVVVLLALCVPIGIHAAMCLAGVGWTKATLTQHAIGSLVLYPLAGIALWASGGADSYLRPIVLLASVFTGYFFPPVWRWVLTVELIAIMSAPLIYEPGAAATGHYASSLLAFSVASVATMVAVSRLKTRLVEAERVQHTRAMRDPLTGAGNRRAFDEVMASAIERDASFAMLFVDLDDFKRINDDFGHPEGDRVLCEVASRCDAVVRAGDCLARIGGDEFVVLAFDAGAQGERRIARELADAIGTVTYGDGERLSATVTSARYPDDGETSAQLMAIVDARLHTRKRARHAPMPLDLAVSVTRG